MAQTLANFDAALKDFYQGPIIEQLNQKSYCLDQIERDEDHIDATGRRVIIPVHKNRNRGRKSIADGGTLPTAGQQEVLDAIDKIKFHMYGIELTDQTIEATKKTEGAFIDALTFETKGVAQDMKKDINRQVFGTGDGLLATCGTTSGSKTVKLENSAATQYIHIGDTVDIIVKSSGATSEGAVATLVEGRSVANGTITTAASVTTDNTYGVYISGNRNTEMNGLRNISKKNRTLHEINSETAGNAFWNGNERLVGESASKTAVAGESAFEQLADEVGAQGNGDVEVYLTTRGVRRRLADSYSSQKRYNDKNAVDVHGGYSAIMVNEIPVISDDDCPKTWAFGFNKSALRWVQQVGPGWLQSEGGAILQLKNAGEGKFSASWQGWWKWYAQFMCVAPNRTGALLYCTDDAPVESN